ncbi:MAG: hypothetical protein H0W89_04420 [Candidatus Levybacteria bacterium]|nr:hypothetical protein [Candidatus Levybacteria bacterium]
MFNLRNRAFVYIFLTAIFATGLYTTTVTKTYAASPVTVSAELPKAKVSVKSTALPTNGENDPVNTGETPVITTPDAKYFSSIPSREYYLSEALEPQAVRNLYSVSGLFFFLSVLALNAVRLQQILQPIVISSNRFANTLSMKYRNMSMKVVDTLKGGRIA